MIRPASKSNNADWLNKQPFYELCQQYRHSHEFKRWKTQMTTVEAFEALKKFIRKKMEAEIKHDDQRSYF